MSSEFRKRTHNAVIIAASFIALAVSLSWGSVGQSAVITLVFPPGARATGLGEAFLHWVDGRFVPAASRTPNGTELLFD